MPNKKSFFSKSSKNIISIKSDFITKNKILTNQAHKWNKFYSKQIQRKYCKTCGNKLKSKLFVSHFASYTICSFCGHLNGMNADTQKFNEFLYKKDSKKSFSKFYFKDYDLRVKNISLPKLNFLQKILRGNKEILEIGSGAGHFLKACEKKGIKAIGYEVNSSMVNLGKKMLKKNIIKNFNINDAYDIVLNCDKEVLTLLGVIEHLEHPNLIFENFKKSKAKYLFIAVPTLSLSVFLEHSFQNVFPRVLGGVHNHLYTQKSLNFLIKKFNLKIIGEWWFGSDMLDLMRAITINSKPKNKIIYKKNLNKYFNNLIDDLQSVLDKKKLCSDVHMVISKK